MQSEEERRRAAVGPVVAEALIQVPLGVSSVTVDRAEYVRAVNSYEARIRELEAEVHQVRLDGMRREEAFRKQYHDLETVAQELARQLRAQQAGPQFKSKFAEGFATGLAPVAVSAIARAIRGGGSRR